MTGTPQHGSATSLILVCLLLLAQWTGFAMVLCVSGRDHVAVEDIGARCCLPPSSRGAGPYEIAEGSCTDCTDMPLQTASAWDPSRRQNADDVLAAIDSVPAGEPVGSDAGGRSLEAGHPPSASKGPVTAVPLRC